MNKRFGRPLKKALIVCTFVSAAVLVLTFPSKDIPAGQEPLDPPGYEEVAHVISREAYARATTVQRAMLRRLAAMPERPPVACCWESAPPWTFMQAFNSLIQGPGGDFELGSRWSSTASGNFGSSQGTPVTLTYSFVPDGTSIPSGVGEPAGTSNLFLVFNSIFSSQATWQNAIHQAFQRWGELTGITYVYEPNDDGAAFFGAGGVLGVRGDVRIAGKHIDGQSGANTLAYNFFPSGGGDMVLDTDNASYFSSSSNNFRRLRNVVMHEHGHGMGLYHVCPDDGTKLMEPVITTSFDGPQEDDIRGGQRHYGDPFESNDSAAQATDEGTLGNGIHVITGASIDDNSDVDYYKFTVTGNKSISVTLAPLGSVYNAGPQNSNCTSSNTIDALAVHDLGFQILDTNGSTVLASVNQNGVGVSESVSGIALTSGPGTYYIRINGSSANDIQRYSLNWVIQDTVLPAFTVSYPNGVPAFVVPDVTNDVDIATTNVTGAPDPAAAFLFARIDGGTFQQSALQDLGGGLFRATLPAAPCFSVIEWYVSIGALGGGTPVISPSGAPSFAVNTSEAQFLPLTVIFADDFENDLGWTVVNDAALTDGAWERGVPVGGGVRGDPPTDSDGSGSCYLTGNAAGNSDVDGGATMLLSPVFNLSGRTDALVEVDIWFDNDFGSNPGTEPFFVQISDDGGSSWVNLEIYNQSVDAWVHKRYRLSDFPSVALTGSMRMRFKTQDPPPGSVVEAGVDAFKVSVCEPAASLDPACAAGTVGITTPGGVEDVLTINFQTGGAARRVDIPVGAASVIRMTQPTLSPGPAPFIIFGMAGVPTTADATVLPLFIGTMCFPPTVLDPTNPALFVLTDNLAGGTSLIPSSPAPWLGILPGIPFPAMFTFQPVILEDGFQLRTGNALILNIN